MRTMHLPKIGKVKLLGPGRPSAMLSLNSTDRLCSTGHTAQYTVTTQRETVGKRIDT